MPSGKIKKIVVDKGFGFIRPDDGGEDVFFHYSSLGELQIEDLNMGDAVRYEIQPGKDGKGPRAIDVNRT